MLLTFALLSAGQYTLSPQADADASRIGAAISREMEGPVRQALRDQCGRAPRCSRFITRTRGQRIPLSMLSCFRALDAGHPMRCVIHVRAGAGRQPIHCRADFREVAAPARWTDRASGTSTLRCSRNLIEATT